MKCVVCMKRVGATGVHHKSYVPIQHSFYTHIHKNLNFKRWISCCSTLPGIYSSPGLPLCAFHDERTQPYSNHNKVMSVTTNKHTHLYNLYCEPFATCSSSKHTNSSRQQDRQCKYKLNTEVCSHSHWCHGKAGSITHSECVSMDLIIKHAEPV